MKHLFLPYDLALLAKEKGFDEPCMKGVKDGHEFTTCGFNLTNSGNTHEYTLPLYQQLVDWFRMKGIEVRVDVYSKFCGYFIKKINKGEMDIVKHDEVIGYYECFYAALTEAFKLI